MFWEGGGGILDREFFLAPFPPFRAFVAAGALSLDLAGRVADSAPFPGMG